ncbi:polyadenylation and cleavage factor homolog 4-like isoform X2 [Hibiscus syriacus]|uniref:polyadenylation and cleavage factor homolog 4-like isoform X2 n=1 Tax=Hibiscus syriacus TaxID=106335 RepID=UPI00192180C5|nr:polyadenylation and cleavage factor homolog 4-like isoform X2 [Hibiscus syriacus]
MENPRRSFDRSRGPGLKKPRLNEDLALNRNARPFPQRTNPAGSASALRFQPNGSDTDDMSPGGGAYEPQPVSHHQQQQQHQELVSQYKTALAELTFNSKPIITNLTIIAGENVNAAKAITATVCANILEVPSDQKLPSLYLLDSIVKNIGRDYIKHFASRLPEVFCKAYRQVDPPVCQSMRHLFGTWKGVFPPPTLQVIEKELGFAPMINGSSSGTTTSRSDPLSQRPPHSIHVNPKYLDRHRLQQSSRVKGMVNDMTGTLANSKEDYERPDRAAITTGRPYGDPSVKMNANGVGVGRASVTEAISSQRNGFNVKHGSQNYSASKSGNADPRLLARQNIAGRSSKAMLSSWKNSEEEEFMWEMHSRLSQHDAANISNNSRKDHWTLDASEKLDLERPFRKAQSIHDVGSRIDRETSSDSLFTEQKEKTSYGRQISSAWPLQESHKTDGLPAFSSSHSESYSATIGGLPSATSSSLARIEKRTQTGSSHLGQQRFQSASPPEQSPLSQHSSLPSFSSRHTHQQLQNFVEPQTHSLPPSDPNISKFLGKLGVGSLKHSHQVSSALTSRSSYPCSLSQPPKPDLVQVESSGQTPKPLLSQFSKVGAASIFGNASETNPLATGTSEPSSTSSLLDAVMKSGILSNNSLIGSLPNKIPQDLEQVPSQPGIFNSSGSVFHNAIATTTNSSRVKVEQLPPSSVVNNAPVQTSDPESKASVPVSNLLSSLVAKGLISASKDAMSVPSLQIPTQMKKSLEREGPSESLNKSLEISTSSPSPASSIPISYDAPRSSTMDEISFAEPATKCSVASHQSASVEEVENLIGLEFRPDVIREFHSSVISGLLDNLPYCCSLCGLRLKLQERLNRHLEWHTMKKAEPKGSDIAHRGWYAQSDDWIAGKPVQLVFESTKPMNQYEMTADEVMVPADEDQYACLLCGEIFEDFFSQDRGEWMFKGAVYLTILSQEDGQGGTAYESGAKGPIVHANCMSESSVHDLVIKMEKGE